MPPFPRPQHGLLDKAEELFGAASGALLRDGTAPSQRSEAAMWVEAWQQCARSLNHWDSLLEYANRVREANGFISPHRTPAAWA